MSSLSPVLSLILQHRAAMTASQGRLADWILANPMLAATMGIEELAEASGVSIATVNRFVKTLGLNGYAEFRTRSLDAFRRTIAPVEKLRERKGGGADPAAVFADGYASAEANLAFARDLLNSEACALAADVVARARTVAIVGLGISAALAQFTAEHLAQFAPAQVVLTGFGGPARMVPRAMRLEPQDAAIVITLPRYSATTVRLTRSLNERDVPVVGITDAPSSPIVPFCRAVLFGGASHPVLFASSVGIVAAIEALAAVLTLRTQTAADAARLTEQIYPFLFEEGEPGGSRPEDEW
ncbi:MurR/RpiR family transcriptional regulator [Salinarimonas ramus]|uniref:Transcriptional regulator n=1 Tax=Salinarimonas ramus TaxID=690164 RepID=A0A917Q499_9HYPH|nr:MurR/RpiR family transcriptional regulator [Salinarimonas ramus]GGK20645.1 transcriptional regulator [Salinarimonas ramus]